MALILCLETATHLCSVALVNDGRLVAERNEEGVGHIHAERLHVLVQQVMEEAVVPFDRLNAVAVGIGPGSYTGLRIGVSAAKGYCHALGIPIIGVGTLHVLAAAYRALEVNAPADEVLLPMIDARRMEVFTLSLDEEGRPDPERVQPLILDDTWRRSIDLNGLCVVFGDGADKAPDFWVAQPLVKHRPGVKPWARAMARIATERLAQSHVDDLAYLVPRYGKEANVTLKSRSTTS
ncbi:MAG: tRNA (adenosine(37)-N6)-threonylcarbamoyltransferase complex dimerization subunit type 1 TsaB [Flavobacteriales bacterium]|nr:tRNA (adenosine(37)-N6)-threonylcarbamoyltransferase complex dimerization subunit type 1 TsaB [Flavobacteriales bacterium]